jgi:hypothetical protein
MKVSIHLHQFTKMFFAFPASPMPPSSPFAAPQSLRQHPAPQRLRRDLQDILARQMIGCQRRPKSFAHLSAKLLPHQLQNLAPKLLLAGAAGDASGTAMLQPCRTLLPVTLPQMLGLPIARPQQLTSVHQ